MAKRANEDFPICQYSHDGVSIFLTPNQGWLVRSTYVPGCVGLELRATALGTVTQVKNHVRGHKEDMPVPEARKCVDRLLADYHREVAEVLPTELLDFLYRDKKA